MGYEYDDHTRIQDHQFSHKNNNIFLPMFCRLSIKDVKLNNHYKNPVSAAGEPSSPKVTCIGQVKRNNCITSFPTAAGAGAGAHHHKHTIPKKVLFPSKTLLPNTVYAASAGAVTHHRRTNSKKLVPGKTLLQNTAADGEGAGAAVHCGGERSGINRSCRTSKQIILNNSRRLRISKSDRDCNPAVDIGQMDPPLPVVKRVAPPGAEVNIWKRRFNGVGLENLQIEQIKLPNRKFGVCTDKNRVSDK